MIRSQQQAPQASRSGLVQELKAVLGQLEAQAVTLVGSKALGNIPTLYSASDAEPPESFRSITDAKDSLDLFYYRLACGGSEEIDDEETLKRRGRRILGAWFEAFHNMLRRRETPLSSDEQHAADVVSLQHLLYVMALNLKQTGTKQDDMLWDKYTSVFERLVSLAESICGMNMATTTYDTPARSRFTLDTGLVAPMYDVACRCRDPFIRRRALRILCSSVRQEGIFQGGLAALIAQDVINIEEEGIAFARTCADIPVEARISFVIRTFDTNTRHVHLIFVRYDKSDMSRFTSIHKTVAF
ncbi:hypothetical protein B9Z65_458 [Elsinoe australis]|uniref:Uncharacterized protein n=1 Tax=Elsinoe australis TaxID=40998 RepID=A0A2P8AIK1_9PEZI|nr:hypothetical protein B9Z65_458 [Elsinoe australis]